MNMDTIQIWLNMSSPESDQPSVVLQQQQYDDSDPAIQICEWIPTKTLAKQTQELCRTPPRAHQSIMVCVVSSNVLHNRHCFSFSTSAIFWAFFFYGSFFIMKLFYVMMMIKNLCCSSIVFKYLMSLKYGLKLVWTSDPALCSVFYCSHELLRYMSWYFF